MKPRLTIVVHPSGGKDRPLTVDDAMGQILDVVSLIGSQRSATKNREQFKWIVDRASTNSPLTIEISAEGEAEQIDVWGPDAADQIEGFTRFLHIVCEEKTVPDYFQDKSVVTARRIFKRNTNGIGVTELHANTGSDFFLDHIKSKFALETIEKFSLPKIDAGKHRSKGEVRGYLTKAGDHNRKSAFWIRDRRGKETACVLEGNLAESIGDTTKLIDVWRNREIIVSGIKHYDNHGRLLRLEVLSEPLPFVRQRVNLDRVIDTDFTGGFSPEDHLRRLRGDDD